jgi:hypothetical protein
MFIARINNKQYQNGEITQEWGWMCEREKIKIVSESREASERILVIRVNKIPSNEYLGLINRLHSRVFRGPHGSWRSAPGASHSRTQTRRLPYQLGVTNRYTALRRDQRALPLVPTDTHLALWRPTSSFWPGLDDLIINETKKFCLYCGFWDVLGE